MNETVEILRHFAARVVGLARGVVRFYVDGFRGMTLGRTLWVMILLKIAILFLVFKLLFFPDILSRDYADDAQRAQAVRTNLLNPNIP